MKRTAFTLIELLVVIAIIGVLIALLVPAVQKVREMAARTQCNNNLKQLALAIHSYHDQYKVFPSGTWPTPSQATWQVLILPFVEQNARFAQFDFNNDLTVNANSAKARAGDIPVFICPSDPSNGFFVDPASGQNFGPAIISATWAPTAGYARATASWARTPFSGACSV